MKAHFQYTPLIDFMGGVYNELIKSGIHARGLQAEYLAQMDRHPSPMPVTDLVQRLEVNTITIDFSFKQISPEHSVWDKLLIFFKMMPKTPDGVFLLLTNKKDATLSFSVSLTTDNNNKMKVDPDIATNANYFVVTKIG